MDKKVLYLTYDGLTDPLGQSQILPYVKELSKLGYQFTILSCDKPARYAANKKLIEDACRESNIEWVSFPFTNKYPFISKMQDRRKFLQLAEQLHKKNHYSLTHCRSYISAEIGLLLKRKYAVKFLFDMRGFWANEKVDGGNWNMKSPLYRMVFRHYKKKEKEFLTEADYSICLTSAARREMFTWPYLQQQQIPLQVIPCCVDTDLFDPAHISPAQKQELLKTLQIEPGRFVITYLGGLGTWYMLNEMLDFFKRLLLKKPEAVFLFVTPDDAEEVYAAAALRNIPRSTLRVKQAARAEVPVFLSITHLALYFIRPTYSKISSSATKQAEIMAMGIPIITNTGVGDVEEIFKEIHAGELCNQFTNEAYDAAIDGFIKTGYNADAIRNYTLSHFKLQHGVEIYREVYQEIFKS